MASRAREGFPKEYRIVRGADYRAAYGAGRKVHRTHFVLFALPNKLGHHRLGITVTRKVGSAVVRNRIKRLFREIFRRDAAGLPGSFDLVVNARRGAERADFGALRASFVGAALEAGAGAPVGGVGCEAGRDPA